MARIHVDLTAKGGAEKIAAITRRNVAKVMQIATVEFYRQVIISTPVDTGRARHGWNITIQSPSLTVPPEGQYSIPNINEHGLDTIVSVSPEQIIYITNRVPYIEDLNKGSSRQAPARFVELAAERVQRGISALVRKSKNK
jgi:hypothetical protein